MWHKWLFLQYMFVVFVEKKSWLLRFVPVIERPWCVWSDHSKLFIQQCHFSTTKNIYKIYLANQKLFSNFEFSQKFIAITATHLHINIILEVLETKLHKNVETYTTRSNIIYRCKINKKKEIRYCNITLHGLCLMYGLVWIVE